MKYVYSFTEGNKDMRDILGGKGANLAEMTNLNLPVPEGFTVTTLACNKYYTDGERLSPLIEVEILEKLSELEECTNRKFGSKDSPLLVSVRSGSPISMPGMMDTILNLGMNDEVCESLALRTNNPRFAYDSYRRLIQMFADVVMGFPKESFEGLFDDIKKEKNIIEDTSMSPDDLREVIARYKDEYFKYANEEFPQDPKKQLIEAVKAVFRSWNNKRAITYRKLNHIDEGLGTAVNIQRMVYGNTGENSGTGVAFTRNPSTGENYLYGEYLINAQGEDVVAGIRTPQRIETLKEKMPKCYDEFERISKILENHYRDMQDMEFTIEDGKLYMLQTRNGKRTAKAAIKIAVSLYHEKVITKEEALLRVSPESLDQLLHPVFKEESLANALVIAEGLAASPGAATGKICFTAEDAKSLKSVSTDSLILVREETSPEDIEGMSVVDGILTVRGGMTSHAAVVARGMGTCCVSGCGSLIISQTNKTLTTSDGTIFREGDYISLDGSTGKVYGEKIDCEEASISGEFEEFMSWADEVSDIEVRANADTKGDALHAKNFGARGIGLCRTEHMFFSEERIFNIRKMITALTSEQRIEALQNILPYQEADFIDLFTVMKSMPVIIRLLDPPLHEFLPKKSEEILELANALGISVDVLENKIESLREFNPMMGHRGCRLDVTYPEIARMQTRAIIGAAIRVKEKGIIANPEIMIPLIVDLNELNYVKSIIVDEAKKVMMENSIAIDYKIGTMIETPRAAMISDEIAKEADFFSFGTNDLTQLTYGFSRDDASKFLYDYYDNKIFDNDPFQSIDEIGVGQLVKMGVDLGRKEKPNIELGICGEHGGDPKSITFCQRVGLDYVSCSPFRVPVARLAAAQAAIKLGKQD